MATAKNPAANGRNTQPQSIRSDAEMIKSFGWFLENTAQAPDMTEARGMAYAINDSVERILRTLDDWPSLPKRDQVPDEPAKRESLRQDARAVAELVREMYSYQRLPGCLEGLHRRAGEIISYADEILDTLDDWVSTDWGAPVTRERPELSVVSTQVDEPTENEIREEYRTAIIAANEIAGALYELSNRLRKFGPNSGASELDVLRVLARGACDLVDYPIGSLCGMAERLGIDGSDTPEAG